MAINNSKKATVFQSLFNFHLYTKKKGRKRRKQKATLGILSISHLFLACVNFVTVKAVYIMFVHIRTAGTSQL